MFCPITRSECKMSDCAYWDVDNKTCNTNRTHKGDFRIVCAKHDGSPNMNIDGSIEPVEYTVTPNENKIFFVSICTITLVSSHLEISKFGGIENGLNNGVILKVTENGIERNITELPIKRNIDLISLSYDNKFISSGYDMLLCRLNFLNGGTALRLNYSSNDNLKVIINDDLTSLYSFKIILKGYEVCE